MAARLRRAILLSTLLLLLPGCNFFAGVGMDIEDASRSIERMFTGRGSDSPDAKVKPANHWTNTPATGQTKPVREGIDPLQPTIRKNSRSGYTRPAAALHQWPS